MTFAEQYALATDQVFVVRVQQAAVAASIALMADPATPVRVANYCANLLNNPLHAARNIAFGAVTNAALSPESSDSDLQWTINSLMRAFAGELPAAQ